MDSRPDLATVPARTRRASRCGALWGVTAILALLLTTAGCGEATEPQSSWAPQADRPGDLQRIAYVDGEGFVLETTGGQRSFIPGVNIGSTVPGTSPGEVSIGAEECRRWFSQIGELQLRSIRIYTILPPHFYEELVAYNEAHPDAPLYLLQGVWIPEEEFLGGHDLYSKAVRKGFAERARGHRGGGPRRLLPRPPARRLLGHLDRRCVSVAARLLDRRRVGPRGHGGIGRQEPRPRAIPWALLQREPTLRARPSRGSPRCSIPSPPPRRLAASPCP